MFVRSPVGSRPHGAGSGWGDERLEFTTSEIGDDVHDHSPFGTASVAAGRGLEVEDARRKRVRFRLRLGPFAVAVAGVGGAALALRVLLMVGYAPVLLGYADEYDYVNAAAGRLFSDPFRPAGYPLFLRVVHFFSGNLAVTVAVQHALGLACGVVAYAIARRIGAGRWFALVAAAIIVLSGDQLYLEHVLLSDGLFLTILLLACYCALRLRECEAHVSSSHRVAWALVAGALAAALVTVRTIGLVVAVVLLVWLLSAGGTTWRRRLSAAGPAALVCTLLLLGYASAQQTDAGVFGLSRFSGWPLYGRVAPFANCKQFTPPAGTAGLCQAIPARERPGPNFYVWQPGSPAHRVFGPPPSGGAKVGAFARSAILAQPGDYLSEVLRDLARYVDPGIKLPGTWGAGPASVLLDHRGQDVQTLNLVPVHRYYGPVAVRVRPSIVRALTTWQQIIRIHGWLMGLTALLASAGIWYAPDKRTRTGLSLLLATALVMLFVSTMVSGYWYRYGIPSAVLLLVAGARGAEVTATRARQTFLPSR
jgi:hypothetical protein